MKEYKDCYIAFIDLLGFKNIVKSYTCDEICQLYEKIVEEYTITVTTSGTPLFDHSKLSIKIMSDTICFYIESSIDNSLAGLIAICNYFQVRLMRLSEPILTRGAIVRDRIYAEGDITFGPGVVKAYLLEEKVAKYPRIILTKSVIDSCGNQDKYGNDYIKEFTYRDSDCFYVLDSLFMFYGLNHEQSEWKRFALYVKNMLDTEHDLSIREKYVYLENSINRAIKKYMEYIKEAPHA